jgi:hypothetical protein
MVVAGERGARALEERASDDRRNQRPAWSVGSRGRPGAAVSASATIDTNDDPVTVPVASGGDGTLAMELPTPTSLRVRPIDLTA